MTAISVGLLLIGLALGFIVGLLLALVTGRHT